MYLWTYVPRYLGTYVPSNLPTYAPIIYVHSLVLSTYLCIVPAYLRAYVPMMYGLSLYLSLNYLRRSSKLLTYLQTYVYTYVATYIPTYLHTYIATLSTYHQHTYAPELLLPGRLGLNRVSLLSSYPIDKKYNYWRNSLKGLIVGVKFAQRGLSPGREVCEKITLKS